MTDRIRPPAPPPFLAADLETTSLRVVDTWLRPQVAEGFASQSPLRARLEVADPVGRTPPADQLLADLGVQARVALADVWTVRSAGPPMAWHVSGQAEVEPDASGDDVLWLSSRHGEVRVWRPDDAGGTLLRFRDAKVEALRSGGDDDVPALAARLVADVRAHSASHALVVDDLTTLTGGFQLPAFLETRMRAARAGGEPLTLAAAAGTLARLGPGPTAFPDARAYLEALAHGHLPVDRVRRWWKRQPEAARDWVARSFAVEVADWEDRVEEVVQGLLEEVPGAVERARAWLEQRDDLASLAFVLLAEPGAEARRQKLLDADARVSVHHSAWSDAPEEVLSERLRAVAELPDPPWWSLEGVDRE